MVSLKWLRHSALWIGLTLSLSKCAVQETNAQSEDVLLTMPITVDGNLRNLQLLKGESYQDAAVSFAKLNGLMDNADADRVQRVVDQLSTMLRTRMEELRVEDQPTQQVPPPLTASAPVAARTVQMTLPLTVDGRTSELQKFEDETPQDAVIRFLEASPFSLEIKNELLPQLINLVNQKLAELQPPRKELFNFMLTIDGQEAIARHFENGDPMEEARECCRSVGVADGEFLETIAAQVANEIAKRINESKAQPQQEMPQEPPQAPKELLAIPLEIDGQNMVVRHFEGSTSTETARKFLIETLGVTDQPTLDEYLPQFVELIDSQMAIMLKERQAQTPPPQEQPAQEPVAPAQEAAAAPVQEEAPVPQRQPLMSLPVTIGDSQFQLNYFEGDSIQQTAEVFLRAVGMDQQAGFAQYVEQLANLIQERLQSLQQTEPAEAPQTQEAAQPTEGSRPEPMFSMPVTLSGVAFDLEYFEGQEPNYVANTFCVEKYEMLREQAGLTFDNNMLQDCRNVLADSINNILRQQAQQQAEQAQAQAQAQDQAQAQAQTEVQTEPVQQQVQEQVTPQQQPPTPEIPSSQERVLLFTLDIDLGRPGGAAELPVYRGDNPTEVAKAFCDRYGVDTGNVPALVDAIESQLTNL